MCRRTIIVAGLLVFLTLGGPNLAHAQSAGTDPIDRYSTHPNDGAIRATEASSNHLTRNFDIELREDDTVAISDEFLNLPGYPFFSYTGPDDVEWLEINGGSSFIVDGNRVIFVEVGQEFSLTYRSSAFASRDGDEVTVIAEPFTDATDPFDTTVRVIFPPHYQLKSTVPSTSSVATGIVTWAFGPVTKAPIEANFSNAGEPGPRLDLPVDYAGRNDNLGSDFTTAFRQRTLALFDHEIPIGDEDDHVLPYNGLPLAAPEVADCMTGFNCLDGNDGYDFSPECPAAAPCEDSIGVYAAAAGTIVQAGWADEHFDCRITVDHGGGWQTIYARLDDPDGDRSCPGILKSSGSVTRTHRIGTFGANPAGKGQALHFVVTQNGIAVDPSGWGPDPVQFDDPWRILSGFSSSHIWSHSLRTARAVSVVDGGRVASQYYDLLLDVPAQYHASELTFYVTDTPVIASGVDFSGVVHSFTLDAIDGSGQRISQLARDIQLTLNLDDIDFRTVAVDSLALWMWDDGAQAWEKRPVSINLDAKTVTALASKVGIYAFAGDAPEELYLPFTMR